MKGHQHLIALRRRGVVPASVCLNDFPVADWVWRDWHHPICSGVRLHADIAIHPDDNPARLDLRFCIGMMVHVVSLEYGRAMRFAKAALEAGARRVAAGWGEGDAMESAVFDWVEDVPCR